MLCPSQHPAPHIAIFNREPHPWALKAVVEVAVQSKLGQPKAPGNTPFPFITHYATLYLILPFLALFLPFFTGNQIKKHFCQQGLNVCLNIYSIRLKTIPGFKKTRNKVKIAPLFAV